MNERGCYGRHPRVGVTPSVPGGAVDRVTKLERENARLNLGVFALGLFAFVSTLTRLIGKHDPRA